MHERRSASLVRYLLHRDIGIIAPWAGDRSTNGTGCFALVETYDKSRKLNHRYRLLIIVRHEQRTNCKGKTIAFFVLHFDAPFHSRCK